jgi:glucarate dehydratase
VVGRYGFSTIKYKGGVKTPEEEIENLRALRLAFPKAKLRYDPQAIFSPATSLRLGKKIEDLDLEYLEDPCWGNEGMARVRDRLSVPMATNMCVIDLDGVAVGLRMGSIDVVLGDIFEWGGISRIKKLQGACDIFQLNLNFHSAAELGIGTAAYLHLAASVPALPHALDTHILELAGDVVMDGTIRLTERGTIPVPSGPGLGVQLDPERFAVAAEAHARHGDKSVYADDVARAGAIPVKSMF